MESKNTNIEVENQDSEPTPTPQNNIIQFLTNLNQALRVNYSGFIILNVLMVMLILLYSYYGIISFVMFNPAITLTTNSSASDYIIYPCVVAPVFDTCPDDYILINTTIICDVMQDRIGNYIHDNKSCILNNAHCIEYAKCECLDNDSSENIISPNNYTLYFICPMLIIFSALFTIIIIYPLSLRFYPKTTVSKVHNVAACITIWSMVYVMVVVILASLIFLPIATFSGIKGNSCEYVCDDCYWINFTLNPIVEVECAVDNDNCYDWYGIDKNYNDLQHFNANNDYNPYDLGVILITFTVVASIIYAVVAMALSFVWIINFVQIE